MNAADEVKDNVQAAEAEPQPAIVFPVVALVSKSADKIPVTVVDQAHMDRLMAEHGAASVEVQA